MAKRIAVVRTVAALRRSVAPFRRRGETLALVPTMGALHAGHLALVRRAQRRASRVVVSIFVNPAQFSPSEDLSKYPRTWSTDLQALEDLGADLVWAPSTDEMYPEGFCSSIGLTGPAAVGLEDAFRPHFFNGVATVVAKLFLQCLPDLAMFGEKDFQQLRVVERMARDLNIPLRIVGVPTVRERDGLALSSRNVYLSAEHRAVAPTLFRTLSESARAIEKGEPVSKTMQAARDRLIDAGFVVDYFEARDAETLLPLSAAEGRPMRLLAAARLGATRLIDNVSVGGT